MKFKVIQTCDDDYIDGAPEIEEQYLAQFAVEQWAKRYDSDGDYTIVGGTDAEVTVLNCKTGERSKWVVSGVSVPQYHASLV